MGQTQHLERVGFVAFCWVCVLLLGSVTPGAAHTVPGACSSTVIALGFSDALDKQEHSGKRVAGLSALAYDAGSGRYLALPDHMPEGAVVWPLTGLDDLPPHPRIAGAPIRLRGADGRPLAGRADNEGIAALRDGSFVVSSERGPRISVFARDGSWRYDLEVPPRYRIAPLGGAAPNKAFEGLTVTPDGDRLIAAMERGLIDEEPRTRRFLDYRRDATGRFRLVRELVYRAAAGMRISEIAAYADDRIVVLEAAYSPKRGSSAVLATAMIGHPRGPDTVRRVARRPLADLVACPRLGARSREYQRNPLLDNYEGMAVVARPGGHVIHLLSDDNYSPAQTTRLLTLWARLPGPRG